MKFFRSFSLSLLLLLLLPAAAGAAPVHLLLSPDEAWVTEQFPSSGKREVEEIIWPHPPAQLDMETLQLWHIRRPVPFRNWEWMRPEAEAPSNAPVVWRPGAHADAMPEPTAIRMELEEPLSHRMGHALTYRLPGLDWQAFYNVTVRGAGAKSGTEAQVDIHALLLLQNKTGTSFSDVDMTFLGIDQAKLPPPKPFGLLAIDRDSPLSDLWQPATTAEPLPPTSYDLKVKGSLPAYGRAEITFATVTRKPARISHVYDSDYVPMPSTGSGVPLRRILQVQNTKAVGLGFPLPPGQASIRLGVARTAPIIQSAVAHTPFPGDMKMELGRDASVRATRQLVREVELTEDIHQADYRIILYNDLESAVRIDVFETPDTPMNWRLTRSSIPAASTADRLHFNVSLAAGASTTIQYRLQLTQPGF